MLNEQDKAIIISWAKKYQVQEIYLFGSSLKNEQEAQDIDLAVRGIAPAVFFDFYGKLLRAFSKPVDLVNLTNSSRFTQRIEQEAIKIYGETS